MHRKIVVLVWIVFLEFVLSSNLNLQATPLDDWHKLIADGSSHKFEGQYNIALQSFTKALSIAEQQKLPIQCLPISLCRVVDVEVTTNKITDADKHFSRITGLVKEEKAAGTLDPQLSFWTAVLSDSYLSNTKPETRETCLKRACYLKELIYGGAHKECLECLHKLAAYYIDEGKIEKAIHILTLSQTGREKQYDKKPEALAEALNGWALQCGMQHKYAQAKQLELAVIKLVNDHPGDLRAGLPAFYTFLGMNSLGEGRATESKEYFSRALFECSKIKTSKKKKVAEKYLALLIDPISFDFHQAKLVIAQAEIRQLLAVEQVIGKDKNVFYVLYTLLAASILGDSHGKAEEYEKCLNKAISIANMPNSCFVNDIPDLYMRLGLSVPEPHKKEKAAAAFNKALEAEKDKHGYHAVLVKFWWGWQLFTGGDISLAAQKLDMALKDVRVLSPSSRGTLLADVLQLRAQVAVKSDNRDLEKLLSEQSVAEIQLQKKLKAKLGPDFYHRMQK